MIKYVMLVDTRNGKVEHISKSKTAKILRSLEREAFAILNSSTAKHVVYALERRGGGKHIEIHIIPHTTYTDKKYASCFKGNKCVPLAVHK